MTIASIGGGSGTSPLTLSFVDGTPLTQVQEVLARIGFSSSSDSPSAVSRVFTVSAVDGVGGISQPASRTVGVTPVNDVPVVTVPTTAIMYTENGATVLPFVGSTAIDPDLANSTATTATLTVTNTNGDTTDRLAIVPSGVYTVVGNELRANNVKIATIAGGAGTTPLVLTFTSNMARVQAAMGLIGFSSISDAPSTTPRVISVGLTDAASQSSILRLRTVSVTAVNDAPQVTLPTTAITYIENAPSLLVFSGATAIDADLAVNATTSATLTVTNTNAQTTDLISFVPSAVYSISVTN